MKFLNRLLVISKRSAYDIYVNKHGDSHMLDLMNLNHPVIFSFCPKLKQLLTFVFCTLSAHAFEIIFKVIEDNDRPT